LEIKGRTVKKSIAIIVVLFLATLNSKAQTCGFGCLGMSGFYGGYTVQEYNAENFNSYVAKTLGGKEPEEKFGMAQGYRFGANIFRADFGGYFVTAKGFYQLLKERHEYVINTFSDEKEDLDIRLNYWGLGLDFGFRILNFLDLKLLEGGATIFNSQIERSYSKNSETQVSTYETVKTDLSYYVGTGLIIHIIPNYISLEGTAFYGIFTIDKLENEDGNEFPLGNNTLPVFEGGKFGATVQINLGLPL
jgi:hypothetical protein